MDWGIRWHNVPFHHSCSTYNQLAVGLGQLGSSEHPDSQQQEFRDCWGVESLDAVGKRILVQLPAAMAETVAEQDGIPVRVKT
jgi:hypothetical protein